MANWNQQAYIDEAIVLVEGEANPARWPVPSLRRHLETIHAKEWRRLLNVAPLLRVSAFGPIALSATTPVAFQSLADAIPARFYRVMSVVPASNTTRACANVTDELIVNGPLMESTGWAIVNDSLIATGRESAAQTGSVNVQLTTYPAYDPDNVIWPETHEFVLVYELAIRMLTKGAAESDAASTFVTMAQDARTSLFEEYQRRSFGASRLIATERDNVMGESMTWKS